MTYRSERYRQLLPVEKMNGLSVSIIGVGAIGRQVGLQLAAMGVGAVQLIDFDTVEEVNLGPQAYLQDDVGRPKVQATADVMQQLNHQLAVDEVNRRFARSMEVHPIIFCCVDAIEVRRHIWSAVNERIDCFIDGRMAAEVLRVISVVDLMSADDYPKTLFAAEQAYRSGCTAQSTVYCANIAAGVMVHQFTRWLRGIPVDFDLTLNLLAGEMAVA